MQLSPAIPPKADRNIFLKSMHPILLKECDQEEISPNVLKSLSSILSELPKGIQLQLNARKLSAHDGLTHRRCGGRGGVAGAAGGGEQEGDQNDDEEDEEEEEFKEEKEQGV